MPAVTLRPVKAIFTIRIGHGHQIFPIQQPSYPSTGVDLSITSLHPSEARPFHAQPKMSLYPCHTIFDYCFVLPPYLGRLLHVVMAPHGVLSLEG